jgi:hypothetical protein
MMIVIITRAIRHDQKVGEDVQRLLRHFNAIDYIKILLIYSAMLPAATKS